MPLSVFVDNKGVVTYIRAKHIKAHLRKVAKVVCNIEDVEELKRWSPYSIRVGAAVRLHIAGKDGTYIQIQLRWRSKTFMIYLQNTIEIADQQHVN